MSSEITTQVLDRMLDPVARALNMEAARSLLALRADPKLQQRVDELAEKCNQGDMSAQEREEYEQYILLNNLLGVLQAKAKQVLGNAA
jgi:hypothetical protein